MRALALATLLAAGCYDLGSLENSSAAAGDGGVHNVGSTDNGGAGWETVTAASGGAAALRGVFGSGAGDVVAVGASSTIVRLAAKSAPASESAPPGYNLRAVWVGSAGALAVGDSETVLMRGGATSWDGASFGDPTLFSVTGLPGGGAIAVGSGGSIVRQTAAMWSPEVQPEALMTGALRGVVARADGDVIAVGEAGVILHGIGTTTPLSWSSEPSGVSGDLFAAWTTSTETWIVGSGGVILHAGSDDVWTVEPSGTTADLFGVSGDGDSLWAVGAGGTVVRRHAGTWALEAVGGADLHAVFASGGGEAWAVGDAGTILHRHP
jgi:hypothetical protein